MRMRQASMALRLGVVLMLTLGLVGMAGGYGRAQEATAESEADSWAMVTVTGRGKVTLPPTRAAVETVIEGVGDTPADAEQAVRTNFAALRQAAEELGFELVPGMFSLNPRWEFSADGNSYQNGFEARRFVDVIVPDPSRLGQALEELAGSGISVVYNVTYGVDDETAARDEALRRAMEDARQQAEAIARYTGLRVGKIMTVTVGESWPELYGSGAVGGADLDVAAVTIQVSVTVSYELVGP